MTTTIQTPQQLDGHHVLIAARRSGFALVVFLAACSTPRESQTTASLDQTVLGTGQSFAVLGGTTVTNTGSSVIHGELGVQPGLSVTGFPPGQVVGATIHTGDALALQAQNDITLAYVTLAGQTPTQDLSGQDLGGLTLTAGVYHFSSSAQLTGALRLDAQGDPNAVFVFQVGSSLTTASNASVELINGGVDCNVFWQVGSSATLGTTTAFKGNIIALASITLNTNAMVSGRTLARTAAVTLDTNAVTIVGCDVPASGGQDAGSPPLDSPIGIDAGVPIDSAPDAAVPADCDVVPPPVIVDAGVPDACAIDAAPVVIPDASTPDAGCDTP
jgi:hypothetical protein